MPLPSALAARLAKRGLIIRDEPKKFPEKEALSTSQAPEEEVFAEDYDDPMAPALDAIPPPAPVPVAIPEPMEVFVPDSLVYEAPACHNIKNKFHTCSDYCRKRWGFKDFEHQSSLEKKHERLLRKYPLPDGWFEVGDPNTGRYYYWNVDSDQVSWLPPSHPRTDITLSANKLKESLPSMDITEKVEDLGASAKDSPMEDEFEEPDFEEIEREILKEKKRKERKGRSRRDRDRDRRGDKEEALDPMDPASYSDIARGGWSAGLDIPGAAKTGVDSTASGPLFQQRPYPSPGAVLRANAESSKDKS